MATINYDEANDSRFAEDLKAAAQPAITDTELTQAYKWFGQKKGQASGKTDKQLHKTATATVLNWWKTKGKAQGLYNETKGAGKPLRVGSAKPPKAPIQQFGPAFINAAKTQYGIQRTTPAWAKRNAVRFNQWLEIELRRRGMIR